MTDRHLVMYSYDDTPVYDFDTGALIRSGPHAWVVCDCGWNHGTYVNPLPVADVWNAGAEHLPEMTA